MKNLKYYIVIDAPREKVWQIMLDDGSYRIWTEVFTAGSHYKGDWSEGSRMYFLAPSENGDIAGMISRIAENRKYEYISIEHIGMLNNGIEDTTSPEVLTWAGARENYSFKTTGGKTRVDVEMATDEAYTDMFNNIWPKALKILKELCEQQ